MRQDRLHHIGTWLDLLSRSSEDTPVSGSLYSYSELTKTSTALARLALLFVLSAARRLVLIFVNSLYLFKRIR